MKLSTALPVLIAVLAVRAIRRDLVALAQTIERENQRLITFLRQE